MITATRTASFPTRCWYEPRSFKQRRPDRRGGWIWNLRGIDRLPYRLPELLAAAEATIFIVEGEKDVDNLVKRGLVATCNSGGAGKWQAEFAVYFKGRDVVIVPDNDQPGRAHGATVAANLGRPVARQVRVVDLAGLPEKGDVSDWLAAGGTCDQLEDLSAALVRAQALGLVRVASEGGHGRS